MAAPRAGPDPPPTGYIAPHPRPQPGCPRSRPPTGWPLPQSRTPGPQPSGRVPYARYPHNPAGGWLAAAARGGRVCTISAQSGRGWHADPALGGGTRMHDIRTIRPCPSAVGGGLGSGVAFEGNDVSVRHRSHVRSLHTTEPTLPLLPSNGPGPGR